MNPGAMRGVIAIAAAVLLVAADAMAQEARTHYYNADWSPDGETIVFESDREGDLAVYAVRADGTGLTRVSGPDGPAEVPRFSPDGEWITFVTRRGDEPLQLYVMSRTGSDVRRVEQSDRADYSATWSPDGKRLAFMSRPPGPTVTHDIHVVGLDGEGRVPVTGDDGNDLNPDWSPDGEWIVFVRGAPFHKSWGDLTDEERSRMRTSRDVWIVRPDGTELTRLTDDDVPDCCPHWSADGSEVLYRHGEGSDAGILGVRPGGAPRRIAGPEVAEPNPSPDGTRLAYTREADGAWGVFVYELESGTERRIVP